MTARILTALTEQDPPEMLEIADRIFSEGRNPQHFIGELTRQFRNLMVMKVSGTDTRLVAAGEGERRRAAEALENFSREDLTRYVQLLLDLYRDLQHAPQPRFRTEIGLLKLVYAGQLRPIEEALSTLNGGAAPGAGSTPPAAKAPPRQASARSAANPPARKLAPAKRVVVAAPSYLERMGTPKTPDDLDKHDCLTLSFESSLNRWEVKSAGGPRIIRVNGSFQSNNAVVLHQAALEGVGLFRAATFVVGPDIDAGRLIPVLQEYEPEADANIYAVYPTARHLSPKVRVFVDTMVETFAPVPPWDKQVPTAA